MPDPVLTEYRGHTIEITSTGKHPAKTHTVSVPYLGIGFVHAGSYGVALRHGQEAVDEALAGAVPCYGEEEL